MYLFADGRRVYDGALEHLYPTRGAALDGDSTVWRAQWREMYRWNYDLERVWEEGGGVPERWARAAAGEAPGCGEWAGA